jgi:hypothetical protein
MTGVPIQKSRFGQRQGQPTWANPHGQRPKENQGRDESEASRSRRPRWLAGSHTKLERQGRMFRASTFPEATALWTC